MHASWNTLLAYPRERGETSSGPDARCGAGSIPANARRLSQSSEPPDARSSTSSSHACHAFTTQYVKAATGIAHSTMKTNSSMRAA